jgi:hypothetical protein
MSIEQGLNSQQKKNKQFETQEWLQKLIQPDEYDIIMTRE